MRVEDFNKPRRNGRVINNEFHFLFDIYAYDNIDYDKKELIQSVHKYLKAFPFNYELDYALGRHQTFVQCENNSGTRFLSNFNLITFLDNDYDEPFGYDSTEYISKYELYERSCEYRKVGSQKYINIGITVFDPNSTEYEPIYFNIMYTQDGHAFVNDATASIISKTDINTLGRKLVGFMDNRYSRDQASYDNEYSKILKTRYEKGYNDELYQVRNGNLYEVNNNYKSNDTKQRRLSTKELLKLIRK